MTDLTVSHLQAAHARPAAEALARAFDDDPLTRFLLPDPVQRPRVLASTFAAQIRDGLVNGEVLAAFDGDLPVATAVWIPPEAWPMSIRRQIGVISAAMTPGLRALPAALRAGPRFVRAFSIVERLHPDRPQWYLSLLGTDPRYQGRGAASRLLAPVLERCDALGLHAYLETGTTRNLAWYAKHHFVTLQELRPLKNGPPLWTMERISAAGP
ncbi:MAG: GNAT family N-acetyltransferase [Acidimicrobiia bacterium]|nr:GNAT family N-acetyltransferase [Acidimicrobiia bacterium]